MVDQEQVIANLDKALNQVPLRTGLP